MRIDDEVLDCAETEPAMEWVARHPGPWFALVWAPVLLVAPVADSVAEGQVLRVLHLVLLGVVYAATAWLPFRPGPHRRRAAEGAFALLVVASTGYLVAWRTDREFVFPLLALSAAVAVRRRSALPVIGSLTISGAVAEGVESGSLDAGLFLGFAIYFAGVGTFAVQYLVGVVSELTRTREQLARAAVSDERLRFSRDLHDLLGHTLSVIVVKAQAVRRLIERDQPAATENARDIETIGRQALHEVREAVTGYRSVRLVEELANARAALAAGNIRAEITPPPAGLDDRVDSLLGWVVREGTTNVLRHAGARRCRVAVVADGEAAGVEIIDDGRGGPAGDGSGLRGLRERVEAMGGELSATATPHGFRLAASVPVHTLSGRR